jgi:hypothetical protein
VRGRNTFRRCNISSLAGSTRPDAGHLLKRGSPASRRITTVFRITRNLPRCLGEQRWRPFRRTPPCRLIDKAAELWLALPRSTR